MKRRRTFRAVILTFRNGMMSMPITGRFNIVSVTISFVPIRGSLKGTNQKIPFLRISRSVFFSFGFFIHRPCLASVWCNTQVLFS